MAKHALLGASSSKRWLACTPSARMGEHCPDTPSEYAAAGTLAHSIAELKARKHFVEPMGARSFNSKMKKLAADPLYDKGMDAATDTYLEFLKDAAMSFTAPPFVALEVKVNYSTYAPEGFGTSDCVMIGGDTLWVVDYKNGSGVPVSAEENSQMKLYALGAMSTYAPIYGDTIQHIKISIIQPNINNNSTWEISRQELEHWGNYFVKPRAALAFAGEGECVPDDGAVDGHCRFCPCASNCRARATMQLEAGESVGKLPPLLTDAEVGEILSKSQGWDKWRKSLKEYALNACLDGKEIPGWKAVEGRSDRKFDNKDQVTEIFIAAGYPREILFNNEQKALTELEELTGKSEFKKILGSHIIKPPGKPTLATAEDKREPYNSAALAFGGTS